LTLLTINSSKPKSDRQREKEHKQRRESRRSRDVFYRKKKKPAHRRRSHYVHDLRLIKAVFNFAAVSLSILLLPFGLIDWGRKSIGKGKASDESRLRKTDDVIKKTVNSHGYADASVKKEKKQPSNT